MALLTILHVVATLAALGIISSLDRMNIYPVAPVAFRFVIAAKLLYRQVVSRPAAGMAIETKLLNMALLAILGCLARNYPMASNPV